VFVSTQPELCRLLNIYDDSCDAGRHYVHRG
jgi:hypothetical protein